MRFLPQVVRPVYHETLVDTIMLGLLVFHRFNRRAVKAENTALRASEQDWRVGGYNKLSVSGIPRIFQECQQFELTLRGKGGFRLVQYIEAIDLESGMKK